MLLHVIDSIPIILGSQSPRRKQLLESLDLRFEVLVREVEELIPTDISAAEAAEYIALKKILAFDEARFYESIVITADTVVVDIHENVLGKPKDVDEAVSVLSRLSGDSHVVYTGVAIAYRGIRKSFTAKTIVHFHRLTTDEINYYVHKYRPYDKAGSYGIQEWIGRVGVDHIEGSFENVMGLPTSRLYAALKEIIK